MATLVTSQALLDDTDGYAVESPQGELGRVEEVWLDDADRACAVAIRTADGRRALLLEEDVAAVQREQRWIVTPPQPHLRELEPPRLESRPGSNEHVAASWRTTGTLLPTAAEQAHRASPAQQRGEQPLWRAVALLYGCLALVVALVMALAFVLADLVGGAAY